MNRSKVRLASLVLAAIPVAFVLTSVTISSQTTNTRRGIESATALNSFFKALRDLKAGRRLEPVRIVHYGDSHTAADILTADIRRSLQTDFGYGGSAVHMAPKPFI